MPCCERDGCKSAGRLYYKFGTTISSGPFNFSTLGPVPDQPIALCSEHALADLGVAFDCGPDEVSA